MQKMHMNHSKRHQGFVSGPRRQGPQAKRPFINLALGMAFAASTAVAGCSGAIDGNEPGVRGSGPRGGSRSGGTGNVSDGGSGGSNSGGTAGGSVSGGSGGSNSGGSGVQQPPAGGAPDVPEELTACSGDRSEVPLVRRLTHAELVNSVRDILSIDISTEAAQLPVRPVGRGNFLNNSSSLVVVGELNDAYADLAAATVEKVDDFGAFVDTYASCSDLDNADCAKSFVEGLGLRLMRAPVPGALSDKFQGIFEVAKDEGLSFEDAAKVTLEGMLQSPRFFTASRTSAKRALTAGARLTTTNWRPDCHS